MRILVTAGNTQSPIDKVRCITNVFSGRTGARIALAAVERGHETILLTSHPDAAGPGVHLETYRTFEELEALMARHVPQAETVIHAAAVNDYHVTGVYALNEAGERIDASAGKVKGSHGELWLKLTPATKLIDKIRTDWGFTGTLVKFKLEVGIDEEELRRIAEASRIHSRADWMVANTLEDMHEWAMVGNAGGYEKVVRRELAAAVVERVAG